MPVAPPLKTSAQLFLQAAEYAEKARTARSEGVRRAFERLASRFQGLAAKREAEENARDGDVPTPHE